MATVSNSKCFTCKLKINIRGQKQIFCDGDCKRCWHAPKCLNISDKVLDEIANNVEKSWFCSQCTAKRQQRRSTMNNSGNINIESNDSVSTPKLTSTLTASSFKSKTITLDDIYEEIIKTNRSQIEVERKLNVLQKTIDDYKNIIDALTEENIELRNSNNTLLKRVNNIDYAIDTQKQAQLNRNIIINGIPEGENENTVEEVIKIGEKLNIKIEKDQIESAIRLKTTNENAGMPKTMLIKFRSKEIRDELLKKKKRKTSQHWI